MPEFRTIVPVLKVADLDRAVNFYTNILGFTVEWRAANDGGGENAMLVAGATNLLLSTGSHLGDTPHFTGTLYFNMIGVRKFFEAIKDRVEIVWPLETMEYGQQEFGIRDLDGYMMAFPVALHEHCLDHIVASICPRASPTGQERQRTMPSVIEVTVRAWIYSTIAGVAIECVVVLAVAMHESRSHSILAEFAASQASAMDGKSA